MTEYRTYECNRCKKREESPDALQPEDWGRLEVGRPVGRKKADLCGDCGKEAMAWVERGAMVTPEPEEHPFR